MSQLVFDEDAARQIESVYRTREAQQRRRTVRETLAARPASACSTSAAGPGFYCAELAAEVGPSGSVVGRRRQRGDARAGAPAVRGARQRRAARRGRDRARRGRRRLRRRHLRAGARVRRPTRGPGSRSCTGRSSRAGGCSCGTSTGRRSRCRTTSSPGACRPRGTSTSRTVSLPRVLAPALRAVGFEDVRAQAHPLATIAFDPETFGGALVPFIAAFVGGRAGVGADRGRGLARGAAGARRARRVLLRGHAALLHRSEALLARRLSRSMNEPREPIRTEVHRVADPDATRVASYLAQPGEVGRVLLLYSGGLDTSVMLKWIQDEYEAEVVALTVNLGQPGEDYEVVKGKALRLGAIEAHVVDAREEFAQEYVLPAIKANADYGDGYPLFTALGRPLIAKLAVEYARKTGCDTIAHGCTGKGNDQVRIEGTVATLAPELKVIAPVRSWQMGRDEEIAYARKHGIPVKGGTESAPYSIDDNLWGRSSEGKWIEDLSHAPDDDVFQLVTRPELAPDEPQVVEVEFERGVPVALDGERLGAGRPDRARGGDRLPARRRHRRSHRGPHRGPEGARHLRGAGGGDPAARAPRARAAGGDDPPEPVQAAARPAVGVSGLRGPVVGAAADRHRGLHGRRQRAGDRQDRAEAVQGPRAGGHARVARTRSTTRSWRRSRSPAGCSRSRRRRGSSRSGRCSRGWRSVFARATAGRLRACSTSSSACWCGRAARSILRRKNGPTYVRAPVIAGAVVAGRAGRRPAGRQARR